MRCPIFSSNYQQLEKLFDDMQKIGLKQPTRVSINITRKCNLRCPHCLSNSGLPDENELTTKELFNLIDQLKENGKPILAVGGGEPLVREDIFEVLAHAKMQGVPASIVTNSLLLTKEKVQKLNSLGLILITVSVDGLEKNHDFMRGEGTFKKTIKNIRLLKKYINTAELATSETKVLPTSGKSRRNWSGFAAMNTAITALITKIAEEGVEQGLYGCIMTSMQ